MRFAMMEGTTGPHTARGLCFPETRDVAVLLLQEKTDIFSDLVNRTIKMDLMD